MGGSEIDRMRVDVAVGIFLVLSGSLIYLLFGDGAYGAACAGVGVVFIARSLVRAQLFGTE